MAGHSKWANIRHRKNKQDAAKGKIFTKLIREITVAAKGGSDIESNAKLRLAIDKALAQNMSRDTIERAIKRGAGGEEGMQMEEVTYEGYAPGGVALLVECLTDNRNRTAGEVRHIFAKHGGNLGTTGSVSYLFKQCGIICFPANNQGEEITSIAIDHGADDITMNDDSSIEILTSRENFITVKSALEAAAFKPEIAELSMVASTQLTVSAENNLGIISLVEALDSLDDVQNVYTNVELCEESIPEE